MMSDFSSSQFVSESAFEYLLGEVLALDDTEQDSDVSKGTDRLDNMGYDVGYRVVESISSKLPFIGLDPLDRIKFLCKDFWIMVFHKKMDKLQTNHRGVFVLTDNDFKWLQRHVPSDEDSQQQASKMMRFMCGIIRGAMDNLGIPAMVSADFSVHPACNFNLKIK